MTIKIKPYDAFDLAFKRDPWIWLKAPLILGMVWLFYLPQTWKLCVLLVTCIISWFIVVNPIGEMVSSYHILLMLAGIGFSVWLLFWYMVYVLAYISSPGWENKLIAISGLVIFPVIVIGLPIIIGFLFEKIGVPQEEIFLYIDKWTPNIFKYQ